MKRRGSLGIGLALCAASLLLALAPNTPTLVGWLARWWPVAPILLGAGSLIGFASRRHPRSPLRGAALILFGGVALAVTLQSATNPLTLYGRFWPLLLGVVALVEIIRHYSYKPGMGESRPALFSAGKLALVGLIVVSGLAANRLAEANPNFIARISMPAGLDRIRDDLFGEEYTFDALSGAAQLPAGGLVSISNRYGDVVVEAGDGDRVEVTVTPAVHAYDRAAAERVAGQLRLAVANNGTIVDVGTNRGEIDHEITTNMRVRVPKSASLRVAQAHGGITITGVGGDRATLAIDATHAPVEIRDVAAAIEIKDAYDKVEVARSSGSLNILGRNDVVVSDFGGAVRLEDSDSVKLANLTSPTVDLVSVDHASVSIENVSAPGGDALSASFHGAGAASKVNVQGEHTSVAVKKVQGDVTVKTTHDDISAQDVTGALEVDASHASVEATSVGSLRVKTDHDDVRAKNVAGSVDIENDHGAVVVSGFGAGCSIRTSFDTARLEVRGPQSGDISVENEHGKIDVTLPAGQGYQIVPTVRRGEVRIDSQFEQTSAAGAAARRVVLTTTYDDVVVRPLVGRADEKDPA
jgi:DUF4097 and DUF4098 domain-containing protein YvlB